MPLQLPDQASLFLDELTVGAVLWLVLYSGYGTDWTETDFSYDLIDGRRTYVCHFIGTLEEPYKQSGFIEYYVYSEGWDIWFEAYST